MPIENEIQNDVATVFAMEGITLTPEAEAPAEAEVATPEPIREPLDELEQLRADIVAFGDPALLARFERTATAIAELEAASAACIEQGIQLVYGHELDYVEMCPNEVWLLWTRMSRAERLAFTARVKEQEAIGPFAGLSDLLMRGMEDKANANS